MAEPDWFRKEQWDTADREDFETRLIRARAYNRGQYLRIQAVHLASAGLQEEAIELLDRMLDDYPEQTQLAAAHVQKAYSLDALDDVDGATESFRAALAVERASPTSLTRAHWDFPEFIARRRLAGLYDEALAILDELKDPTLAMDVFQESAVRAVIADARGDVENARRHATEAAEAAELSHSGFSRHPGVGLVRTDAALRLDVERLLGGRA